MYGLGILKGLGVTFRHFIATYANDVFYGFNKGKPMAEFGVRQGTKSAGIYTVEYPDEKVAVPERFRFTPFLVVNNDDHPDAPGQDWCTSCGICAKVCPPQCIWIVRGTDPATGRPVPQPEAFFIDIDICMNCGFCAEFCPFDAIKMDHDYEMASYDRTSVHIHDKERLSKPFDYYLKIAPTTAQEEADERGGWEHTDVIKEKKKADAAAAKAAAAKSATPTPTPVAEATPAGAAVAEAVVAPAAPAASAEDDAAAKAERLAKREAALARKKAGKSE